MKTNILNTFLLSSFVTLTGCGTMMDLVDQAQNQEREEAELEKISERCKDADKLALEFEKQAPDKRKIPSLATASRALSYCREEMESALMTYHDGSTKKLAVRISNPDKAKIEFNGKSRSLKEVYQNLFRLEKKLTTLPVDMCMERTGQFRAEGFGGNWEPSVLSMTDWKGAECKLSSSDAYMTSSLSNAEKSHLKNVCAGSVIKASDFKLERIQVNLAKKTSLVWCQKAKERKAASAFLSTPKVDERCEPCKRWVKVSK